MRESQGRTKPVGRNESEKRFGVLGEIPKSVTTTGAPPAPFQLLRQRGGARVYALGPERW